LLNGLASTAFAASSGLNAIAQDTGTLRTDLITEIAARVTADLVIGVDTGTLRSDLNTGEVSIAALSLSTGALDTAKLDQSSATVTYLFKNETAANSNLLNGFASTAFAASSGLNAIAQDTGTLRVDLAAEIAARATADLTVGLTTASLRTDLNTEAAARTAVDLAVGVDTAALRTDLTAVAQSTGTLLPLSGGTMTGNIDMNGNDLHMSGGTIYNGPAGIRIGNAMSWSVPQIRREQ